jgi:hypothetical protein
VLAGLDDAPSILGLSIFYGLRENALRRLSQAT